MAWDAAIELFPDTTSIAATGTMIIKACTIIQFLLHCVLCIHANNNYYYYNNNYYRSIIQNSLEAAVIQY